jgi:hypothetical protein
MEQLGGKAEHVSGDGPAFFRIAAEERFGGARDNRRKLPAEINCPTSSASRLALLRASGILKMVDWRHPDTPLYNFVL